MATFEVLLEEKLKNLFKQVIDALVKEEIKSHYSGKSAFLALLAGKEEKEAAQKLIEEKVKASDYQLLFDRWPALRPMYDTIIRDHRAMVVEFEALLQQYKEEISRKLLGGKPITTVKNISFGDADSHNHGRMVFIVETDGGKFVYKPHSCAIDLVLRELVEKYCPNIIYVPMVVDAGKAGFCEFIENTRATTLEDTRKFYYNLGGLAAIAMALGMYDLHCENILALNTLPVCIDTETALKPKQSSRQADGRITDMENTVLNTLIFSNMPANNGKNLGLAFASVEEDIYAPILEGVVQPGTKYKAEVLQGFSETYDIILANRDAMLEEMKAWHCELRVVLRNTSDYCTLINLLRKPAALEDESWKNKIVAALGEFYRQSQEAEQMEYVKAEEDSILAGDVPRFYTYSDDHSVYVEDKIVKQNYFATSTVENACNNMQRMSPQEKTYEMDIITQCLTRVAEKLPELPEKLDEGTNPPSREELIQFFMKIVNALDDSFLTGPSGNRLMLYLPYKSINLSFMDAAFGTGYGGLAYLGHEALKLADKLQLPENTRAKLLGFKETFLVAMEIKVKGLETLKSFSAFANPLGLVSGLGGELYVLNALEEPRAAELRDKILGLLEHLDMQAVQDKEASLYNGLSGLLYGLASCPLNSTSEKLMRRIADKLLTMNNFIKGNRKLWLTVNDRRLISGLGNGMSGVGYAFLSAYKKLREPRYKAAAKLALEYENEVYSEELKTWPDFRETSVACKYMHGYCSGAPGIYTFLLLAKEEGLELSDKNLKRAKNVLLSFKPLFKDFLCCGNAAVVEALLVAGEKDKAGELLGKMLRRYYKLGFFVGHGEKATTIMDQSLFYGISGYAYIALRCLEPDLVKPVIS